MNVFERWESEIRGYCRAWPTVFDKAANATLIDEDGKRYIDFFAGAGVLNFGHNHPAMKRALIEFIEGDGVAHSLDTYTTAKRDFIEAFAGTILAPRGMNHRMQFVGPTGTNAVEAALKLARRVTGRTRICAFAQGFHGMTLGSLACTANQYFRGAAGVPLTEVDHAPFETNVGGGLDGLDVLAESYRNSSGGRPAPAAFLVETIQAEGGVNVASAAWLQRLQEIARELGALLIIDEIQVGCGRTGQYFSFDGMGLDPDIVCLAKGIGGFGTPLAMNLVKPEHDAHWKPGEHTGTFRGQGLSFVAGREALRFFEDDALMARTREREQTIRTALQGILSAHAEHPLCAHGRGMIFGLSVPSGEIAKQIARTCFENGLLLGPCGRDGTVIKVIPPLTIEDADLAEGLARLEAAVGQQLGVHV